MACDILPVAMFFRGFIFTSLALVRLHCQPMGKIVEHGEFYGVKVYCVHHSMKCVILYGVFFTFRVCTDTMFPEAFASVY